LLTAKATRHKHLFCF